MESDDEEGMAKGQEMEREQQIFYDESSKETTGPTIGVRSFDQRQNGRGMD